MKSCVRTIGSNAAVASGTDFTYHCIWNKSELVFFCSLRKDVLVDAYHFLDPILYDCWKHFLRPPFFLMTIFSQILEHTLPKKVLYLSLFYLSFPVLLKIWNLYLNNANRRSLLTLFHGTRTSLSFCLLIWSFFLGSNQEINIHIIHTHIYTCL